MASPKDQFTNFVFVRSEVAGRRRKAAGMTAGEMAKGKAAGVTAARPRSNEAVLAHGHLSRSVSDEVLTPVSALNHPPT